MPILSYFMIVGSVLAGLLFWLSSAIEPERAVALKTSQTIGIPKPFKALPEANPTITSVNIAAKPPFVMVIAAGYLMSYAPNRTERFRPCLLRRACTKGA